MIELLALLAVILVFIVWSLRHKPEPVPVPEPIPAPGVVEPSPPVVEEPEAFAMAQFNESRGKYAADIDAEAQRLVRKLEIVRQAMQDDMAALKRMRVEADAAKVEAAAMRAEKREALENLEAERDLLRAAIADREKAGERIDELNKLLSERNGEIALRQEAMLGLELEYKAAMQAVANSNEALAQHGLSLNEAQLAVAKLEQALRERDEEFEVQARQIEQLRAEAAARLEQIGQLEGRIAHLLERFEMARRESLAMMEKMREGQQQVIERAEGLETENETMRRHIGETERARDRLLGQVGHLRAENAGLRAESLVNIRDLEELNQQLGAKVSILERMLANARTVRAQPAPARAHLRLIAEAKKAPNRAFGS